MSDSKSLQVSRTLLSILADLDNAVIWMVSTCPLASKSSSSFTNSLGIAQVHQLQLVSLSPSCSIVFCPLTRSWYFSLFSLSFNFTLWFAGTANSTIRQVLFFFFFFFFWLSLGLVVWAKLDYLFVSWTPREVCVSHSPWRIPGCGYTTYQFGQI